MLFKDWLTHLGHRTATPFRGRTRESIFSCGLSEVLRSSDIANARQFSSTLPLPQGMSNVRISTHPSQQPCSKATVTLTPSTSNDSKCSSPS